MGGGTRKLQSGKQKGDDICMHDCELGAKIPRRAINVPFNSIKQLNFLLWVNLPQQRPHLSTIFVSLSQNLSESLIISR